MSRVPNVARAPLLSKDKAKEIADLVIRDCGLAIDADDLAAAVVAELDGWRPMSFSDDGRECVLRAFKKHIGQMEAAHHG